MEYIHNREANQTQQIDVVIQKKQHAEEITCRKLKAVMNCNFYSRLYIKRRYCYGLL